MSITNKRKQIFSVASWYHVSDIQQASTHVLTGTMSTWSVAPRWSKGKLFFTYSLRVKTPPGPLRQFSLANKPQNLSSWDSLEPGSLLALLPVAWDSTKPEPRTLLFTSALLSLQAASCCLGCLVLPWHWNSLNTSLPPCPPMHRE